MDDSLLHTIQKTFVFAFLKLPILLIAFTAFLSVTLGNIGTFMLFLGHTIAVPVTVWIAQLLLKVISVKGNPLFYVPSGDLTSLVKNAATTDTYQMVVPSYWLSQVWFFLSYLFTNAAKVYSKPADGNTPKLKVDNRKARTTTIMIVTLVGALALTALRYTYTNTETLLGVFASMGVGIGLGVGWYYFAELCGAQYSDVFGIITQTLSSGAQQKPLTCVYQAKPN
jgi:hypothetical protein